MDRLGGRRTLKVANFLDNFEKDDVKKRIELVSLFKLFGIELTKKGRNYTGLCPWHKDTEPSLSVDNTKGLYNCFGCGESGDHFTLIEKIKGYGFKEALKYLKELAGKLEPCQAEQIEKPAVIQAETEGPEAIHKTEITLETVKDYYCKRLYEKKEAVNYLKGRGIDDIRILKRFEAGYADGSILEKVSNGQLEKLKSLGIIRETGREHLEGCVVFPLHDANNKTTGFYGRRTGRGKVSHLYLKGPRNGIFNRKASRVYDEIILTESIIDALSLIHSGIENVQAVFGVNGFTEEHLMILKSDRVKTIIPAFDNDDAGREASGKLKERLLKEGFAVKEIRPEKTKDWNEELKAGITKEDVIKLIDNAAQIKQSEEKIKAEKKHNQYRFLTGGLNYRLLGVKDMFVSTLRVNIRIEYKGMSFYDNADMYSSRSRKAYASNAAYEFNIEPERIEKDLHKILDYLEEERDRRLRPDTDEDTKELSPAEVKAGENLLRDPLIFSRIEEAFTELGYIGESDNTLLVYLSAVTCLLEEPLNVYIQSASSAGKSYLLDTLKKLLPEERVLSSSSFSDQALYYFDEEEFKDRVFMLGEDLHNENIEGQMRQMQSEHEISRIVTVKDDTTGMMHSKRIVRHVKMSFMMTSTALKLNPENASRYLVLHVDESPEQTNRVLEHQRKKEVSGREDKNADEIIFKFKSAFKLLKKVKIKNPLAEYIRFPSNRPVMRRRQKQFLTLIKSCCFLRQYQKEGEGEISCDIEDYSTAYELFTKSVLAANQNDMPVGARNLYESIRKMVRKLAREQDVLPNEVSFIQKQVRELTSLSAGTVKMYIRILTGYEYLQVLSGKRHGTRYSYRIREDSPLESIDVSMIPHPDKIKEGVV